MDTSQNFSVIQNPAQPRIVTLTFLLQGQLKYGYHPRRTQKIHGGFAFLDTVSEDPIFNEIPADAQILSVDLHFEEEKYIYFLMQMLESGVLTPGNEKKLLRPESHQGTLTHFSPDIHQLFLQILNCPYRGKRRTFYLRMKILEILFHYFSELQKSTESKNQPKEFPSSRSQREKLLGLADYLQSHPLGEVGMQDLSIKIGMSETALQMAFKKQFGFTVMQYHKKVVLKKSHDLLLQGESIKTTAFLSGYGDSASFSKAFFKEYGIRPSTVAFDG